MELISKKELLEQTGISYGQLYRWKRQGLLPEEWFIKRAVRSGQQTFLPRAQAMQRIEAILQLKDRYPFGEMQALLSPVDADGMPGLDVDELQALGVRSGLIRLLDADGDQEFSFAEGVYLYILSQAVEQDDLPQFVAAGLAKTGFAAVREQAAGDALVTVFRGGGGYHVVFTQTRPRFDDSVEIVSQHSMAEAGAVLHSRREEMEG